VAAHQPPSRNDGVTTRARPRSCRQARHRLRQPPPATLELPPPRPAKRGTVYACPSCEQRYLGEQYCPDCATFCRRRATEASAHAAMSRSREKSSAETSLPDALDGISPRMGLTQRVSCRYHVPPDALRTITAITTIRKPLPHC
jgi:hypothetical protein